MTDARIRGQNLGNMERSSRYTWKGELRPNSGRFANFISLEYSSRAMLKDLRNKILSGRDSIGKIIPAWCPPPPGGDCANTPEYISFVSQRLGISPEKKISVNDRETLLGFASAVTRMEHGVEIAPGVFYSGWNLLSTNEPTPLPPPGVVVATGNNEPETEKNNFTPVLIGGALLLGGYLLTSKN